VLDEADEMLDLGFYEEVERIFSLTPSGRQTALFSATMPPEIRQLADRYLHNPTVIKVKAQTLTVETVEQFALKVKRERKEGALIEVIQAEQPTQAIVFVRTKLRCDQLYRKLKSKGMRVKTLHGDMSQGARDGVMIAFQSNRVPLLIATDVASRGLDIRGVTHVINFDIPTSPDIYVHRIGRTGRVGRSGRAITLYEPRQNHELEAIERHAGSTISDWVAGAHVAPQRPRPQPKRHAKPAVDVNADTPYVCLLVNVGRGNGITAADLVQVVTHKAHLPGEAVRNVQVLERFAMLEIPRQRVQEVVTRVTGASVHGCKLRLEQFKGA
jgi:ATP-dependent RNA helicase DeaD